MKFDYRNSVLISPVIIIYRIAPPITRNEVSIINPKT